MKSTQLQAVVDGFKSAVAAGNGQDAIKGLFARMREIEDSKRNADGSRQHDPDLDDEMLVSMTLAMEHTVLCLDSIARLCGHVDDALVTIGLEDLMAGIKAENDRKAHGG